MSKSEITSSNRSGKFPLLVETLIDWASLRWADSWWSKTSNQSMFMRPALFLLTLGENKSPAGLQKFGTILQKIGFLLIAGLFLVIGLPQFAQDKSALALISLGALILWLCGLLLGGSEKRGSSTFDFLVLLYLGINIVAASASHYFLPSLKGLAKVVIYTGSFLVFSAVVWGRPVRKLILSSIVLLSGLGLSIYGFYQYKVGVEPLATWEDPSVLETSTRIYSTLGNPNLLAGFLVAILPLGAGLVLAAVSSARRGRKVSGIILALLASTATAAIAVAIILTGSRGGYIGLFAGIFSFAFILFLYIWRKRPRWRMPLIAILVLGAFASAMALSQVPAFQQRLASMFEGREHSSNSYRINVWESSLRMFLDNWWIGMGVGNEAFRLAYGLYMVSGYDALGTYCVPLEIAVETGILGLVIFGALVLCALARAHISFNVSNEQDPNWTVWLQAGSACALIALLAHGLVDTVFYRPQIHLLFWLILAFICAPDRSKKD